jgi:hypothetical protein
MVIIVDHTKYEEIKKPTIKIVGILLWMHIIPTQCSIILKIYIESYNIFIGWKTP